MEIYTGGKLSMGWQKANRSRTYNLYWFDLEDYDSDMKLDGESPIVFNDEPILEAECWETLNGSICMLLLRLGMKTVIAVVHFKSGGLRFYSQHKSSFESETSIIEETPGVFLSVHSWKDYARYGLVLLAKKHLKGTFIAETVFVNPLVKTLVEWDIAWIMDRSLIAKGTDRVREILGKEI